MTPNPSPMHTSQGMPANQNNGRPIPNRPAPPRPAPANPAVNRNNGPPPRPNAAPAQQPQPAIPPQSINREQVNAGSAAGGLFSFSSIKDGAGSLFKNLKDTSTKVLQQVQQAQQTTVRSDFDISMITSRILVMPCPLDNIENLKGYVESRYQLNRVSVYNLGPKHCQRLPPPVRTVECGGIYTLTSKSPALAGLYHFIEDMYGFLSADPKSVIIIQGSDNSMAATVVCSLLIYANLAQEPEDAMQIFAVRRQPPNLEPSQVRYLNYLAFIVQSNLPHTRTITLKSLTCSPVPRLTKARDGCRLYVEIANNERVIMSSHDDEASLRLYHASEGKITVRRSATVSGDFTISLYHARNTFGGMGRPQNIKICQIQMHTGFISEGETLIHVDRSEMDELIDDENVPMNFNVSIPIEMSENANQRSAPWNETKKSQRNPIMLFGSQIECEETVDNFSEL